MAPRSSRRRAFLTLTGIVRVSTCDLCAALIVARGERQHEAAHRRTERGVA